MKRIAFIFSAFLFLASYAKAEDPKQFQPRPNDYVSYAVYNATNTGVQNSTDSVVISSYPCLIHTININTAGGAGAKLEVWNSNLSTGTGVKLATIDTTSKYSFQYDIFTDSGVAIFNQAPQGIAVADITLSYREKGR